ncbi:unnamed protein product [Prorocentrum cordatum]|uniref:Protein kinase domain-containing protein n=1 Tax=Prorocentrum cordatum TaxID=2364126 RepID=A0ABN9SKI6_9DINO|nr:unnamed protein product [Polarella glacialis]
MTGDAPSPAPSAADGAAVPGSPRDVFCPGAGPCLYDTRAFCGGLLPGGEEGRLAALNSLEMLDTPREGFFDSITGLLKRTFDTAGSHLVLIDPTRCWFKSWQGIWWDYASDSDHGPNVEAKREDGWCNYIFVSTTAELLVIEDATKDARVSTNPFVVGPPYFRFYAGAPLVGSSGERYGTLCVVDLIPRCYSADEYALLINFAAIAVEEIERNKPLQRCIASSQFNSVVANRHLDMSVQASKDGMLMIDARVSSWPVSFGNAAFAAASGLEEDAIVGRNFWDLFLLCGKSRAEVGLPVGLGDAFEMHVLCRSTWAELSLRLLPAGSGRFAPSKATGIPAWAPYAGSTAGALIDPSPGGSEGDIDRRDMVDQAKCFWFVIVSSSAHGDKADAQYASQSTRDTEYDSPPTSAASSVSWPTAMVGDRPAHCEYSIPRELEIDVVGPMLGSGSFGRVYRALTRSGGTAALKVVDCRRRRDDALQAQLREVQLSCRLDHPNVVKILSYATSTDSTGGDSLDILWCAQELCELGTLTLASERGWLRQHRNMTSAPDMSVVWSILLDVSNAMAYVHSCSVVHADLTGRNVLLTNAKDRQFGFVAKVGDFGLAQYIYGHNFVTKVLGTITHMPPELLTLDKPFLTYASDVWAFGVLAWEAYHGKCAFKGKNAAQVVVAVVLKRSLQWPDAAPESFVTLMGDCLQYDHAERPRFHAIAERIATMSD